MGSILCGQSSWGLPQLKTATCSDVTHPSVASVPGEVSMQGSTILTLHSQPRMAPKGQGPQNSWEGQLSLPQRLVTTQHLPPPQASFPSLLPQVGPQGTPGKPHDSRSPLWDFLKNPAHDRASRGTKEDSQLGFWKWIMHLLVSRRTPREAGDGPRWSLAQSSRICHDFCPW